MRYGLISDIHGNYEALKVVVQEIEKLQVDEILCLGDTVGYGAEPRECLDQIQEMGCQTIAGNHDYLYCGKINFDYFGARVKESMYWTSSQLREEDTAYLNSLPLVRYFGGFDIVHGSLYKPEDFSYLLSIEEIEPHFQKQKKPLCFVGHSHTPIVLLKKEGDYSRWKHTEDTLWKCKGDTEIFLPPDQISSMWEV